MELQRKVERTLDECNRALLKNSASSCAARFRSLVEAEEDRLISRQWRGEIDVDRVVMFLQANIVQVQRRWEQAYRQLKAVLDYGGKLVFEETMLVLTLRSELQLLARFLAPPYTTILGDIDETLQTSIQQNLRAIHACRTRKTVGIDADLVQHWWWRTNAPPASRVTVP